MNDCGGCWVVCFRQSSLFMDKILKQHMETLAKEFNLPIAQIELIINTQQSDIRNILRNGRDIDFILLKGFGTFATHANSRRPFRNDKKNAHGKQD